MSPRRIHFMLKWNTWVWIVFFALSAGHGDGELFSLPWVQVMAMVNCFLCCECRSWRWCAMFLLWRNAAQLGAGGWPLGGARSLVPPLPLLAAAERSRLRRRHPGQAGGPPRGAGEGHSHTAVVVCQTLCWAIHHWFCRSLWKVSGSITADSEVKLW